jgi:hypothetical protein
MQKSKLKIIVPLILFSVFCAGIVGAANTSTTFQNPLQWDTFPELLNVVVNIVFTISLAIAPILFILAGFYFVTAAGKPEQVETAKKMILWTIIGLIVIICSKGIIALFTQIMEVKP